VLVLVLWIPLPKGISMRDDELTITWPSISSDTSWEYDANTVSMSTITNGGTVIYGKLDTIVSDYQFSDWNVSSSNIAPSGQLNLVGDNADIVINGQSLNDTLTAIQERMGMLVPNPDMEAEWDQLRELSERYRELEKLCKEKSTAWNKLKKI
jgi:hypothetical protein